jgi:hypothetical protein
MDSQLRINTVASHSQASSSSSSRKLSLTVTPHNGNPLPCPTFRPLKATTNCLVGSCYKILRLFFHSPKSHYIISLKPEGCNNLFFCCNKDTKKSSCSIFFIAIKK